MPQGRRLFQSLTVDEHLQIVGAKSSQAWTPKRVYELFPRLAERKQVSGTSLSGGEQQMLAIGRALLTNPKLLVMDEPSEGLAPTIVEGLVQTIKDLAAEGMGLLVVEQNLGVATSLAERQLIMVTGADRGGDDRGGADRRSRGAAALPRRRAARRRGLTPRVSAAETLTSRRHRDRARSDATQNVAHVDAASRCHVALSYRRYVARYASEHDVDCAAALREPAAPTDPPPRCRCLTLAVAPADAFDRRPATARYPPAWQTLSERDEDEHRGARRGRSAPPRAAASGASGSP